MELIRPKVVLLNPPDMSQVYNTMEIAGRTCYQSELKGNPEKFLSNIIMSDHLTILEHEKLTFEVTCDRGVSHELVRHRMASFSQESTRYCNYGKSGDITFIIPSWVNALEGIYDLVWDEDYGNPHISPFEEGTPESVWFWGCARAQKDYLKMLGLGWTPQQARSILPNSLKTSVVCTMNFRELRHFLSLRYLGTTGAPHPDMKYVAELLFREVSTRYPILFQDFKN